MREILFRGKAINRDKGKHRTDYKNKEWVYGLITKLYEERFPALPAEMCNEYGVTGIEIDYKTIGQYTDLTDKNGKKIFEGDIVNFKTTAYLFKNCLIKYNSQLARFCAVDNKGHSYPMDEKFEYEIIGNIYDNPELLRSDTE